MQPTLSKNPISASGWRCCLQTITPKATTGSSFSTLGSSVCAHTTEAPSVVEAVCFQQPHVGQQALSGVCSTGPMDGDNLLWPAKCRLASPSHHRGVFMVKPAAPPRMHHQRAPEQVCWRWSPLSLTSPTVLSSHQRGSWLVG